ncbi:hypothetical protein LOAG_19331 [Loa loa]|uniref:Zinc finger protein n=1 Tax=Loa loa TaxID=7209 RepID=A0A1S0UEF8_LOALO|nr:hypothetical protein LOAG_19331 [Loa loa]EJD73254.1 hypothetical protein LOAG_19331 [Loa loa]
MRNMREEFCSVIEYAYTCEETQGEERNSCSACKKKFLSITKYDNQLHCMR